MRVESSVINPRIANLFLHTHYANVGKIPPRLSEVRGHLRTKFQQYTNVFEVMLFNGVVDDVTGSRVIPEIDMAAVQ